MIGMGPDAQQVARLVEDWRPEKAYTSELKFRNDLQEWLDAELNQGGLGLGGGDVAVTREHGAPNADVCVDGEIGIELKRDFSNANADRLRGQIQRYQKHFAGVVVVACGVDDIGGWRTLTNEYSSSGLGFDEPPVYFVHKSEDEFGRSSGGGSLFDNGGLL